MVINKNRVKIAQRKTYQDAKNDIQLFLERQVVVWKYSLLIVLYNKVS